MQYMVLSLAISGPEPGTARGVAEATTSLLRELRTQSSLEVTRISGPTGAPPGSKGAVGAALAELVIAGIFAGSTVTAVAQIIIAFIQRGAARRIVLSDGARTLTVTDPSPETQRAVVDWLADRRHQSGPDFDADD